MFVSVLNICLDSCSVICSEFRHIQHCSAYSTLFRYMLAYSIIFSVTETYSRIFKAHSGLFRHIQHPVLPLHIYNFGKFWALAYLEPETYFKPCETLIRYIQNPAIGHYSDIFRHIQNLVKRLHTLKPDTIQNLLIIASRRIFRSLPY